MKAGVEFGNMLVSNSDFLKPFAITLTRDPEEAKDLFQETLFRALANKEKYNGGTNIRAWLYTIMRNIFINNYRRKVKQNLVTYKAPEDLPEVRAISGSIESEINSKQILQLIHKLPEIFRFPFMLYFDGFKYHEIADIMREPLGTIKSRIHFARKMLKTELELR
jgi:RNA polymerase sigma factor (sigma-70 family)